MNKDSKQIFQRQNQVGLVDAQKTAACCYAYGKKLTIVLAFLLILYPIVVNILVFFIDNMVLSRILTSLLFVPLVIAEVLRKQISKAKFNGAGMQQYFDEVVFDLKNSCKKYLVPKKLTLSERLKLILKYKDRSNENYKNWYSDFSSLPYEQAVYQCQKQNIRWDISVRKKYLILLMVSASFLVLVVILNAIIQRYEVLSLITILSSIFPLFSYFFNSFKKLNSDISTQEDLYKHIEKIEEQITKENEIWNEIEELQVEIFSYRKKAYLIPDWFHCIFKKNLQESETEFAKLFCEENTKNNEKAED